MSLGTGTRARGVPGSRARRTPLGNAVSVRPVTPNTSLYRVVMRPVLPSVVFESITHPVGFWKAGFCCLCLNPVVDLHCKCIYPAAASAQSCRCLSLLSFHTYLMSNSTSNVAVFPDAVDGVSPPCSAASRSLRYQGS